MKKIIGTACLMLALCLLCICVVSCETTSTETETLSYIRMRINPEVELVVNQEGTVVSAGAVNEDGETVLSTLTLAGMTVEEAGEAFTAAATELGFVDVDGETTVYISSDEEDETFMRELEEKLTEKINGFFDKKGIVGKVSPEDMEQYQELAEEWGVSVKDAKLIQRILELYPEMTAEEVLALSFEERIALIRDDRENNGMTASLHTEYRDAVEQLKDQYAEMFALGKQLKDLERQLQNPELSEEESAALREAYDSSKASYDALRAEYDSAVEALKAQLQAEADAARERIHEEAENCRAQNEKVLQEHENDFRQRQQETEERIRRFRGK